MTYLVLTQARLNSKRFPKKILKNIYDKHNSITLLKKRISKSKENLKHLFIIPKGDLILEEFLKEKKINYEEGSENDLVDRHLQCAYKYNAKLIIRITSDCPLVDPKYIDKGLKKFLEINNKYTYISNHTPPENSDFPNGSDIEIFSTECLEYISQKYKSKKDREHVTFPMWDGREKDKINHVKLKRKVKNKNIDKIRITLDYKEDLIVLEKLSQKLNLEEANLEEIENSYCIDGLFNINSQYDGRIGWKE